MPTKTDKDHKAVLTEWAEKADDCPNCGADIKVYLMYCHGGDKVSYITCTGCLIVTEFYEVKELVRRWNGSGPSGTEVGDEKA
jgi:hypothetical protein